ncbi:C2 family cysteine protease [Aureispira anguillae]|uniref:C2 family cysteine protease n=1 Tax=Aureispira anguillae TaxID=2864201 RepID=A0A915VJT4_9BACT|nr:C2 family cysteine protease [Aureispira anguillae]BDS09343.1 C2 family cysteine protease [Aureispira anguillae]
MEENANSSLTEEIDLMRLIALKKLLTEAPGGLNDIYDNIIKTPELKQQYQKIIERIRKDWETDGRMATLKEKIEKKLQQTMERAQDSPCPDEEPEPKKIHEAVLEQKDLSELPLFNQGVGDASVIDSNDIDQGATGDCYYLSSVAALARMQPELFHGKSAIIKKKGENYEVTLHLRKDRNSKKRTPTIITVRPSTWVNPEGKPIYQGLGDDELWAILLEKAYAQALGGYDNIEGGTTKEALEVLTGKVSSTYDPGTMSTDDLMEKIQTSIDCQYPTTFNSRGTGEKEVEISFGGKVQKLFQGHAYTLDKMEGDRIFLYNPHGKHHLELDSKLLKTHFSNLQILEL